MLIKEAGSVMGNPNPKDNWFFTDAGNAQQFARRYGDRIKFNRNRGKWMEFDGRRWNLDTGEGAAQRCFAEMGEVMWQTIGQQGSPEGKMALAKWANYTNSAAGLRAALSLAKAREEIEVFENDLDQEPYLLNCLNGTVDLRRGGLKRHDSKDLLTQLAPVKFPQKDVKIDVWMACLDKWHRGDQEAIGYLRRLAGMCLTGDTSSRVFPIFYGAGRNGKSVFLDTLMALMGDYATVAPRSLLRVGQHEEHATELASLLRQRMVIASETKKGMKLKTDLVKAMTGDSKLKARFMRKDFFDFTPTHKTILVTQSLPRVDEDGDAIWDRVQKMEWGVRITEEEQNTKLMDELKAEWPGILKWAVEGCLEWQKAGMLVPTDEIREQTKAYREDQITLKDFLDAACETGDGFFEPVASMRKAYMEWSRDEGTREKYWLSARGFAREMYSAGFKEPKSKMIKFEGKKKVVRSWFGVRVKKDNV